MNPTNLKVTDKVNCKYVRMVETAIPGFGYGTQADFWGVFTVQELHEDGFIASNGIKYYWMSYGSSWMDIPVVLVNVIAPAAQSDATIIKDLVDKIEETISNTEGSEAGVK
jgi:hypothetical protein